MERVTLAGEATEAKASSTNATSRRGRPPSMQRGGLRHQWVVGEQEGEEEEELVVVVVLEVIWKEKGVCTSTWKAFISTALPEPSMPRAVVVGRVEAPGEEEMEVRDVEVKLIKRDGVNPSPPRPSAAPQPTTAAPTSSPSRPSPSGGASGQILILLLLTLILQCLQLALQRRRLVRTRRRVSPPLPLRHAPPTAPDSVHRALLEEEEEEEEEGESKDLVELSVPTDPRRPLLRPLLHTHLLPPTHPQPPPVSHAPLIPDAAPLLPPTPADHPVG